MKKLIILFAIATTSMVCADPVDVANIVTFQSGDPAVAAEVNGNFNELISAINDNDARLTAIENRPAPGEVLEVTLDCDTDAAILADTITNASLATALDVSVSGTCDPVTIARDFISITGPVTITSDGDGSTPLTIISGRNIHLENVTLDAEFLADRALLMDQGSQAFIRGLTASNANLFSASILGSIILLEGNNTFSATGSATALSAVSNSYLRMEDGITTITSEGTALSVQTNSVVFGREENTTATISGNVVITSGSTFSVFNSTILGNFDATINSYSAMRAAGGGSSSITGTINVNINSYLHLLGDETSTVNTSGGNIILVSNGYIIASQGSVVDATGPNQFIFLRGALLTVFPGSVVSANNIVTDIASYLFVSGDGILNGTVGVRTNSVLLQQTPVPLPSLTVICSTGGVALHRAGQTETDLCTAPPAPL